MIGILLVLSQVQFRNGDFEEDTHRLRGWKIEIGLGCAGDRWVAEIPTEYGYSAKVKSIGAGGCGGSSGFSQVLELNPSDYSEIKVTCKIKIISDSTTLIGGWVGKEYPAKITVYYADSVIWWHGFYHRDPTGGEVVDTLHAEKILPDSWYVYTSENLLPYLPSVDKTIRIRFLFHGAGWDYMSYWDDISLLTTSAGVSPSGKNETSYLYFDSPIEVHYTLPSPSDVVVAIYDLLGRKIHELYRGYQAKGEHVIYWDGRDIYGNQVPAGVYYIRINTEEGDEITKVIRIR